jgi:four helix bundle protein
MNRSAVSIPSNIAEGAGRNTNGEFNQFLGIASGSLSELESQLIISEKIGILKSEDLIVLSAQIDEISKMIVGLRKSLK